MLPTERMSQLMKSDGQQGIGDCQSLVEGGTVQVQGVQEQNIASNLPRVSFSEKIVDLLSRIRMPGLSSEWET